MEGCVWIKKYADGGSPHRQPHRDLSISCCAPPEQHSAMATRLRVNFRLLYTVTFVREGIIRSLTCKFQSFVDACKENKKLWCNNGFGNGIKVVMVVDDGVLSVDPIAFDRWWYFDGSSLAPRKWGCTGLIRPRPYHTKVMWTWWR
jgi:hypothetical protein